MSDDIELVIKMSEKTYKHILSTQFYIPGSRSGKSLLEEILKAIRTGVSLPKGHGRLFDERDIVNGNYKVIGNRIYELEPIIEADKESEEV